MIIVGCDYYPSLQQIAFVDTDTGEFQERRLQLISITLIVRERAPNAIA
jgi:hypothetical protein